MCQDEWLNESVIPSANENATACVTKRLRGVRRDEQYNKNSLPYYSRKCRKKKLIYPKENSCQKGWKFRIIISGQRNYYFYV